MNGDEAADRTVTYVVEDGVDPTFRSSRVLVTSPEASAALLQRQGLHDALQEECWVLLLDQRHRLIEAQMVSRGSIDHTFMSPREIFQRALMANASAVVVGHNHPSGDPEPSADDLQVTKRLDGASKLIGVRLLDHIVLGTDAWVSLARRGLVTG